MGYQPVDQLVQKSTGSLTTSHYSLVTWDYWRVRCRRKFKSWCTTTDTDQ